MLKKFIIISIGCCFLASPTYARNWNLGFKLAYIEPDGSVISSSDNADNVGVIFGYQWPQSYGAIGLEADYTTSFLEGSVDEDGVQISEAFFIDTLGAHATYKTPGYATNLGIYAKYRAGVTYYKVTNAGFLNDEKTEFSFGVGVGLKLGQVDLELDYTTFNDFDMFSLAILF